MKKALCAFMATILILLSFSGCNPKDVELTEDSIYFPLRIDEYIAYDIEVQDTPITYRSIQYISGETTRARVYRDAPSEATRQGWVNGKLVICNLGINKASDVEHGTLYNIYVKTDTLDLYEGTETVYWRVFLGIYSEVLTYHINCGFAPGDDSAYAIGAVSKALYFGQDIGPIAQDNVYQDDSLDSVERLGFTTLPQYPGVKLLHFRRTVSAVKGDLGNEYYDQAFTEDTYYAPGLGLVKSIQTVGGYTTMTMTQRLNTGDTSVSPA